MHMTIIHNHSDADNDSNTNINDTTHINNTYNNYN